MAQLINFERVDIGPRTLCATVSIADGSPLMTSDDIEATARVYHLMPQIVDHVCIGDGGDTFKQAMGNTEIAHLLEHVAVEILARTELGDRISCGRTIPYEDDERCFDILLDCPDDVLTTAALSSAAFVLDWAFGGGEGPEPDIDAIVGGLKGLIASIDGTAEADVADEEVIDVTAGADEDELAEEPEDADAEPADEQVEPEADEAEEPEEPVADAEDEEPVDAGATVAMPMISGIDDMPETQHIR